MDALFIKSMRIELHFRSLLSVTNLNPEIHVPSTDDPYVIQQPEQVISYFLTCH